VAAGGDGTVRLVADRTLPGTPLYVFPLGTENLLARYLGTSAEPAQAAKVIGDGRCVRMDAGVAGGQLFTLMAGCGFDADVVRRLHQSRQGHIHHWSYAKPILDAIRTYDYPELRVYYTPAGAEGNGAFTGETSTDETFTHETFTHEISARWVFVVNLPRYAGGLCFSSRASGSDGLLDVCTFKEGSLWYGLMYLGGVMLGQHEGMHDFCHVQTRRVRIQSAEGVPYQLDGDPGGELPVEVSIAPRRLTMVVSRDWVSGG
jgi:diacylglycerol kinase (ATP)